MPSPNKKVLKAYLAPEEYEKITAMAKQAGVSLSTFAKRVCLGQEKWCRKFGQAVKWNFCYH